ncbi:ComEA family DNA-binding protein [Owenweeksia hongkongensis]|uniref:ComEA family DNA-binding protein n=1 Tax=Owenweeksia hongkongensis TaxID=253245 RepID=UPI003A913615
MWKGLKELFNYNKKQRNGLLILIAVALGIQLFLYFSDIFVKPLSEEDTARFASVVKNWEREKDSVENYSSTNEVALFDFDPNTADREEFEALGLRPFLAERIIKYRNKGGQFYKKEDLLNIYGMDSAWYSQVAPYVNIEGEERIEPFTKKKKQLNLKPFEINSVSQAELESYNIKEWQAKRIITFREKVHPFKTKEELFKVYGFDSAFVIELLPFVVIDEVEEESTPTEMVIVEINSADSLKLLSLKGIGPAFSKRILEYRNKLGGFYAKEQLLEVYGMDAERFEKVAPYVNVDESLIKRLDINKATFKELVNHPYLNYEQVKNIVNFREKVRPFKTNEELKHIELIDDAIFSKIANYLNPSPSQ